MSEEFIVHHCSPTLAGIKTGALFPCIGDSFPEVVSFCREMNRKLAGKGLCCIPLRRDNGTVLIYLYRPGALKGDLASPIAQGLLKAKQYPVDSPAGCLTRLCRCLRSDDEFPHEIGLFLGYPPEDVEGFIRNHGNGAKAIGTWKVYGDEEKARATFQKYKRCTAVYESMYEKGATLEQLAVAL